MCCVIFLRGWRRVHPDSGPRVALMTHPKKKIYLAPQQDVIYPAAPLTGTNSKNVFHPATAKMSRRWRTISSTLAATRAVTWTQTTSPPLSNLCLLIGTVIRLQFALNLLLSAHHKGKTQGPGWQTQTEGEKKTQARQLKKKKRLEEKKRESVVKLQKEQWRMGRSLLSWK